MSVCLVPCLLFFVLIFAFHTEVFPCDLRLSLYTGKAASKVSGGSLCGDGLAKWGFVDDGWTLLFL